MANEGVQGTAGIIPVDVSGSFDLSDSMNSTSSAQGGRISNGMIFNTSGGKFGIVKLLTFTGLAMLAYKLFKGRK